MTNQALAKHELQALIDSMMTFVDGIHDQIPGIWGTIKLLSKGLPLSAKRLTAELQLSQDEIRVLFESAELDQEGNLVGFGLSLVPTPHAYKVNDHQLYTWCAADAIMFSMFLKSSAVIESPDPISGEKVRLVATPTGVSHVEPSTAVVAHVSAGASLEKLRAQVCNVTNFFASVETASQYVSKYPGLVIIPVDEVFQVWNRVYDREPYRSLIADL